MTGSELTAWRAANGYSMRRLAAAIGYHHMQVWKWEHGVHPIPAHLPITLRGLPRTADESQP